MNEQTDVKFYCHYGGTAYACHNEPVTKVELQGEFGMHYVYGSCEEHLNAAHNGGFGGSFVRERALTP